MRTICIPILVVSLLNTTLPTGSSPSSSPTPTSTTRPTPIGGSSTQENAPKQHTRQLFEQTIDDGFLSFPPPPAPRSLDTRLTRQIKQTFQPPSAPPETPLGRAATFCATENLREMR